MQHITYEQKQSILMLYKTHTAKEIAILLGVPYVYVNQVISGSGIHKASNHRIDFDKIREDCLNGFTDIDYLKDKYKCSATTVKIALSGIKRPRTRSKQTSDIIQAIRQMSFTNETMSSIAKRFNVSRQYVFKLKNKMEKEKEN